MHRSVVVHPGDNAYAGTVDRHVLPGRTAWRCTSTATNCANGRYLASGARPTDPRTVGMHLPYFDDLTAAARCLHDRGGSAGDHNNHNSGGTTCLMHIRGAAGWVSDFGRMPIRACLICSERMPVW